mmetsp:Transcript_5606/g.15676  ORF Transcript_5606/g.15676 Transcript_5606/m.15676 type:complete len:131 (+) Transcript_5606:1605-1997(+)
MNALPGTSFPSFHSLSFPFVPSCCSDPYVHATSCERTPAQDRAKLLVMLCIKLWSHQHQPRRPVLHQLQQGITMCLRGFPWVSQMPLQPHLPMRRLLPPPLTCFGETWAPLLRLQSDPQTVHHGLVAVHS